MEGRGRLEKRVPARLTPAEGRKFAFTVGLAFLVLAGITWWRDHPTLLKVFASLGGTLLLAGLIVPGKLGPVYRGWMGFALLISKVTTPIFMGITYFVVLAPIGFLMRMFGRNPMVRRPANGSFWVGRPEGQARQSNLNRQF
jgi:hypothetical protein